MAPREVKLPEFPDTLPEDFAEWDGGGQQQPVAAPVKQVPVQSVRPAETRPPAPTRVVAPDREVERPMPQPVVRAAKPVPSPTAKAAVEQTWQPAPRARQQSTAAKPDYAPSSTQRNAEAKLAEALWPDGEQKKRAKTEPSPGGHRTVAIAVGAVVVCAGLGAGYMLYTWRSHAQPHPQTIAETSTVNPTESAASPESKPDPRNALNGNNPAATGQTSPASTQQSTAQQAADETTPSETTQQNPTPNVNMAQFTAQSRIPRNQQPVSAPEPAGNLNASQMAGGNSGGNPMFNTSSNAHVQFTPSKPIEVASGVLSGTLIRKTMPEYPQIARNMHVSGVVTVAITLTPQGTVAEAHAVSGPVLLRPAAVDAVRNWRFKPYLVNGHPVSVQSNVNVDFAMQ